MVCPEVEEVGRRTNEAVPTYDQYFLEQWLHSSNAALVMYVLAVYVLSLSYTSGVRATRIRRNR